MSFLEISDFTMNMFLCYFSSHSYGFGGNVQPAFNAAAAVPTKRVTADPARACTLQDDTYVDDAKKVIEKVFKERER